jgi:hypothetical protein
MRIDQRWLVSDAEKVERKRIQSSMNPTLLKTHSVNSILPPLYSSYSFLYIHQSLSTLTVSIPVRSPSPVSYDLCNISPLQLAPIPTAPTIIIHSIVFPPSSSVTGTYAHPSGISLCPPDDNGCRRARAPDLELPLTLRGSWWVCEYHSCMG